MTTLPKIKRVAVIGAGPAGVATAKYLLAERHFDTIDVFEQRSTAAGVWNYTPENDIDATFSIPSISPDVGLEQPIWRKSHETNPRVRNGDAGVEDTDRGEKATFVSPLYERLEANLPKMLMQHSDLAFPDDEQLFPTHEAITEYLERYADDVRHLIQFQTQVTLITPSSPSSSSSIATTASSEPVSHFGWDVTTKSLTTSKTTTSHYDAVAIASGHFNVPLIPDLPGIRAWNQKYPGRISHSKLYRRPEDFAGKKVLVIGSGYSGLDIAKQIEPLCSQPLLHSTRTSPPPVSTSTRLSVPSIAKFIPEDASIRFLPGGNESNEGRIAKDIDVVIFATGYIYSLPYFPASLTQQLTTPSQGQRISNTFQHMFFTRDTTLAFLALPQRIVPFPVSESQAAVIARVWSGRLALPQKEEMEDWERKRVEERGDGKAFGLLNTPEDVEYVRMLYNWAGEAEHKKGEVVGKTPPHWGDKVMWMRTRIADIKNAFLARGEERKDVRTLEELGFCYEKWLEDGGWDGEERRKKEKDELGKEHDSGNGVGQGESKIAGASGGQTD